jgi:hypothetical protein
MFTVGATKNNQRLSHFKIILISVQNYTTILVVMSHQFNSKLTNGTLKVRLLGINEHSYVIVKSMLDKKVYISSCLQS